jgi:energy-coupling factor transporter ATP-binding protein EcfA2
MPPEDIRFKTLSLGSWRQFDSVKIDFHERMTVITGANGAGKSSLIRLLSRHFGYDRPFLGTPVRSKNGAINYISGFLRRMGRLLSDASEQNQNYVGRITYSNGVSAVLETPNSVGAAYHINVKNQQKVLGVHIDSHQAVPNFQQISSIPTTLISPSTAYSVYDGEVRNRYLGSHSVSSPIYRLKEALISMAVFGEGNSHIEGNTEILNTYVGFIDILKQVLPKSLGFITISIRNPEVVLVTRSGEFMIDASSGGLLTLIDIAWRVYMFSLQTNQFVVTFDEPENHLHPTMQKSLMPRLLDAFPNGQFIIATHSPFMVSAVRESSVYVLRYRDIADIDTEESKANAGIQRKVFSEYLESIDKAGAASEILKEVLGVSSTIPEWVETELMHIMARYRSQELNETMLNSLRAELSQLGFTSFFPQIIEQILLEDDGAER